MEFEAGESIVPPEMYQAYGYAPDALPSDLHSNRIKNKDGEFIGCYSDRVFDENFLVELDFDNTISYRILPYSLNLRADQITKRGLPILSDDVEESLLSRLNSISRGVSFELKDGWIYPESST